MAAVATKSPYASTDEVRSLFEEFSGSWMCGESAVHIQSGDWYWAQRNGPPRILQCRANNHEQGCIVATTNAYPYDTAECYRLKAGVPLDRVEALAAIAEREFGAWSRAWHSQPLN